MGAWINRGERTVYESPWFKLNLADIELPDGRHLDHYLLRQRPVVLTASLDGEGRVLMLWWHRFILDTYLRAAIRRGRAGRGAGGRRRARGLGGNRLAARPAQAFANGRAIRRVL
jgi:hypothetical protein